MAPICPSYFRDPTNREMGVRMADLFGRRADGSEFSAGIRLAPFQDGGATFVVAAIRDMTEHRALHEALVAAREQADRANHAKNSLSRHREPRLAPAVADDPAFECLDAGVDRGEFRSCTICCGGRNSPSTARAACSTRSSMSLGWSRVPLSRSLRRSA